MSLINTTVMRFQATARKSGRFTVVPEATLRGRRAGRRLSGGSDRRRPDRAGRRTYWRGNSLILPQCLDGRGQTAWMPGHLLTIAMRRIATSHKG